MLVVPGTASAALAREVARRLGAKLAKVDVNTFPDGEVYARIDEVTTGEDVVVVETTLGNDRFVELLLLSEAARGHGARRVTCVVPYYAYSRQDRRFKSGEALSAEVVARSLGLFSTGLVTVDPHKEHILAFYPGRSHGSSAVPELAAHFKTRGVDLVLAPDKGALERAAAAAIQLGVGHDHLEKTRISGDTVVMKPKSLPVSGRTVAILDDIISTGGTMAGAAKQLLDQGAKRVICAATHGLFVGGAADRLKTAGVAEIVVTDTIQGPFSSVSAAPAIVRGLEALALEGRVRA